MLNESPSASSGRPNGAGEPVRHRVERHLTQANVFRVRGLLEDAIQEVHRALDLVPTDAGAHELLGDLLMDTGDSEGATEEYREALRLAPDRGKLEEKLGVAILAAQGLNIPEGHHESVLPLAADDPMVKRRPVIAAFSSMILPGLGQCYNGEYLKGGLIFLGVSLGIALMWASLRELFAAAFSHSTNSYFYLQREFQSWGTGRLLWVLFWGLESVGCWTYSLIDAPLVATRQVESVLRGRKKPEAHTGLQA